MLTLKIMIDVIFRNRKSNITVYIIAEIFFVDIVRYVLTYHLSCTLRQHFKFSCLLLFRSRSISFSTFVAVNACKSICTKLLPD